MIDRMDPILIYFFMVLGIGCFVTLCALVVWVCLGWIAVLIWPSNEMFWLWVLPATYVAHIYIEERRL
jgi:hypothetical protein